ncbi:hypothetical protein IQ216_09835, partial [Cyanobium sp. LEGE 06143]|uniref:Ycf66 family protein n=1 Tax=Cyanobium sp. LEGE 06143 TaxID=945727 RepID=UPI001880C1E4
MLATLGGALALMLGLTVLLLPVLASELSRPRDSLWGGVVLLLGLVLVTSAERLRGAPMLAVLCGGLLVGRLGLEVGQARWRQLTPEEQQRLWSTERWQKSLAELGASLARLLELAGGLGAGVLGWMRQMRQPRQTTKRWVRLEPGPSQPDQAAEPPQEQPEGVDQVSEVPAANLLAERPERADAAAVEGATEAVGGTQQAEAAPSEEEAEKAETSGPGAACTPEVVQDAEDSAPAAAAEASDPPADVVVVDCLDGVEDLLQELEGPPDAAPAES